MPEEERRASTAPTSTAERQTEYHSLTPEIKVAFGFGGWTDVGKVRLGPGEATTIDVPLQKCVLQLMRMATTSQSSYIFDCGFTMA